MPTVNPEPVYLTAMAAIAQAQTAPAGVDAASTQASADVVVSPAPVPSAKGMRGPLNFTTHTGINDKEVTMGALGWKPAEPFASCSPGVARQKPTLGPKGALTVCAEPGALTPALSQLISQCASVGRIPLKAASEIPGP